MLSLSFFIDNDYCERTMKEKKKMNTNFVGNSQSKNKGRKAESMDNGDAGKIDCFYATIESFVAAA